MLERHSDNWMDLVFGVGYDANLPKADSSVNFAVRPWVKSADYWNVYFSLTETVKKRFDEEGISIPFPQRDVHVVNKSLN